MPNARLMRAVALGGVILGQLLTSVWAAAITTAQHAPASLPIQSSPLNQPLAVTGYAQAAIDLIVNSTTQDSSTNGGLAFSLSASKAKGAGNGQSTTYSNSQIQAGTTINTTSGGDTRLAGAVIAANRVNTTVGTDPSGNPTSTGGNLTIESLQDTSTYQEKQTSSGGSLSISATGIPTGASISSGKTHINSNYQSVGEQTAIRAGDGGFQVNVQGNTQLAGGQITSTQSALDNKANSFQTAGQLSTTDLQKIGRASCRERV